MSFMILGIYKILLIVKCHLPMTPDMLSPFSTTQAVPLLSNFTKFWGWRNSNI